MVNDLFGDMMGGMGSMEEPGMGMGQTAGLPGLLGGLGSGMQAPFMQQTQNPTSPLDIWAQKEYGKYAFMLVEDELEALYEHILTIAKDDEEYWEPRNKRMQESQKFWEIGKRNTATTDVKALLSDGADESRRVDEQPAEVVELNDGFLVVDKITSMISGAQWGLDVPPKDPQHTEMAQLIEDLLLWAEEELNQKHGLALNGTLTRSETHYAVLRGWITGMILPDPENPEVPWKYVLEDPMFVYPRYSRDKLMRVVHKYELPVLEARSDFPEAFDYLLSKEESEEVEVVTYWDDVYKITLLAGEHIKGDPKSGQDRVVLQPLVPHGYRDIRGRPINPWIIVTPRGTPTRRSDRAKGGKISEDVVAMIGLDVLHPIKEVIRRLERLTSMLHTEVAKGVNPPRVFFYDGVNKPEPLDMGVGGENYLIMGSQDTKILESSAMKPDAGPLLQIYQDRLNRGGVPAVMYGDSGSVIAGYAIRLLTQGARDIVGPIMEGLQLYRKLRYRRMLEMYVNVGAEFAGSLTFPTQDRMTDMRYAATGRITAEAIRENGVHVDVSYDDVLPSDRGAMITAAIGGINTGILSLYTAMKEFVGIKNPKQELQRVAEDTNYKDPEIVKEMALVAAERSGNSLLQEAARRVQVKRQLEQQMMMQQAEVKANGGKGGSPPSPIENVDGSAVPHNVQPGNVGGEPSSVNPILAIINQLRGTSAAQNTSSGGNMPEV